MGIDEKLFVYNWNYPTRVWFGPGRLSEIAKACAVAGMKNPLVVTDAGLAAMPQLGVADLAQAVEAAHRAE
jgi:alcohol dehydrogenase class IV